MLLLECHLRLVRRPFAALPIDLLKDVSERWIFGGFQAGAGADVGLDGIRAGAGVAELLADLDGSLVGPGELSFLPQFLLVVPGGEAAFVKPEAVL